MALSLIMYPNPKPEHQLLLLSGWGGPSALTGPKPKSLSDGLPQLLVLITILPSFSHATPAYIPGKSSPLVLPPGLPLRPSRAGTVISTCPSVNVPPSPFFKTSSSTTGEFGVDSNPLSQIQNKAYKCR